MSDAEVQIEYSGALAELIAPVAGEDRMRAFVKICNGEELKDINRALHVSRSTLQGYTDDLREADLIEKSGRQYELTRKGFILMDWLTKLDANYEENIFPESLATFLEKKGIEHDTESARRLIDNAWENMTKSRLRNEADMFLPSTSSESHPRNQ